MKIIKRYFFSITTLYFLATSGLASADNVVLRWNANSEADFHGYNVYSGTQSRFYDPPIFVGNTTESIFKNLEAGKTYYFAVTAVDNAGNESTYSEESWVTIPGDTDNQAPVISVASSGDDGNVATNTIDNDLTTRWSADGSGQWIQYDLGATYNIYEVAIAFYRGDASIADFEIFVSDDAQFWESVLRSQSSGTTRQPEYYWIPHAIGQFVRIVGYGNSDNTWNSITEVDILGDKYTPPADTANPTIAITSPTTDAAYSTESATLSLGGTANDDSGSITVDWSASSGEYGPASGTTNWSIDGITLKEGNNTITVTATDAAGNQGQDVITVSYMAPAADTTSPAVVISSPTSDDTYTSDKTTINLAGSAGDNVAVSQVFWSSSTGQSGKATGTNSWSIANLLLSEGDNTITVTAMDTAGNTAVDVLTVTYTSDLTLNVYAYKEKGKKFADLTWSGGITTFVDVYRDGSLIPEATGTQNDGEYIHGPFSSGKPATYKICEDGTSYCSNEVTVSW